MSWWVGSSGMEWGSVDLVRISTVRDGDGDAAPLKGSRIVGGEGREGMGSGLG